MTEIISRFSNIKDGHKLGQLCVYLSDRTRSYVEYCKNEGKATDIKALKELQKQWEYNFRLENEMQ